MLTVAGTLLTLCLVYLTIEAALHAHNRRAIPVRIHVNGIRGKSSVTRLIAGGLRAGGLCTVAKTTGTLPRLVGPTGEEESIRRMGRSNVIEQAEVFSWARRKGAEVLVIECMAVQPRLQDVAERLFVRATIGVITNVRADHLDVMGPTIADVARSLSNTIPRNGVLFTAETNPEYVAILQRVCQERHSELFSVAPPTDASALLSGFGHIEHPDNVALALAVCERLGVPRDVALAGMWRARPDPGALQTSRVERDGRRLRFVNALAANDPDSTLAIWHRLVDSPEAVSERPPGEHRVVLVNTRRDRQHRSLQLAELLPHLSADRYLVTGGGAMAVVRRAHELGISPERVLGLAEASADAVEASLFAEANPAALVFAIGNVQGIGLELAQRFQDPAYVL